MTFVLVLILKIVIYQNVYRRVLLTLSLGRGMVKIPSSPIFLWFFCEHVHIELEYTATWESITICFFLWEITDRFFFFCHYSHSLFLLNLPPLCLLWESARSSARWQKPSHHLYLMESLGICGWYFPPKLETSCESRCLLTPCLLSQQSEHQGMFANLMGSWQRPSQTQTLLPASQGRICPHCCFGFERAG